MRARKPTGIKLSFGAKKKDPAEQGHLVENDARPVNTDAGASSPQTASAVHLSSSSQFQGQDSELVAEIPNDKGKGKEEQD